MDWLACVLALAALFLAGGKNRWCWVFSFFSEALYVYISHGAGLYGFLVPAVVGMVMCVVNFVRWSSSDGEKPELSRRPS
jgi:nicotinamide riboside transporter PnuC